MNGFVAIILVCLNSTRRQLYPADDLPARRAGTAR